MLARRPAPDSAMATATTRHPLHWFAGVVAGAAITMAAAPAAPVLDHDTAVHVANRLTFGATAATVARLRAEGLDRWIVEQLHPDRLPDPRLEARLASFSTLALTPRALADTYYVPALERRRAAQARVTEASPGATPGCRVARERQTWPWRATKRGPDPNDRSCSS